jgi:hypothetical protein
MKAASAVQIYRSIGDGDPILASLWVQTEAGKAAVADRASVDLRLLIAGSIVVVTGIGRGSESGIWAFDASSLPVSTGKVEFSIEVTVDGYSYIHGRGWINLAGHV